VATCNSLSWPVALPDGPALFSLRPENVRIASANSANAIRFRGRVRHQAFHGATELLQVECGDGLSISMRSATRENWQGELELEFSPADAVPVRESGGRS
jgi:hypothetical protein